MTELDDWANAASNQENLCQKVRSLSLGCTLQANLNVYLIIIFFLACDSLVIKKKVYLKLCTINRSIL